MTAHIHTVVVGGGQAGLSVSRQLQKRGVEHVVLDASDRIGDAWRNRWDSLVLFTPARIDSLADLPFPGPGSAFPTKDQMGDYLEQYAGHFDLPVRTRTRVSRVGREDGRFRIESDGDPITADNVVVAMSNFQVPRIPAASTDLSPDIVQLHSGEYQGPSQLRPGPVLVVGVGNSGADIALEVADTHHVWLAGKEPGVIPFRIDTWFARNVGLRIVRFLGHRLLSLATPIGRRLEPLVLSKGTPLIRVKPSDLDAAGISRVGRVVGARDGKPLTDDGTVVDAANVIWCTGFTGGFPTWIDLDIFDDTGHPVHDRGVVSDVPGIFFVGLEFLYAETSATITGVTRDAIHVSKAVAARAATPVPA